MSTGTDDVYAELIQWSGHQIERVVAVGRVHGLPKRPINPRNGSVGPYWQPEEITVNWERTRRAGQPWREWNVTAFRLEGPVLHIDGSPANRPPFVDRDRRDWQPFVDSTRPGTCWVDGPGINWSDIGD